MHRSAFYFNAAILYLLLSPPGSAQASAPADALPRDPNNLYGQFDNSVKYIICKNPNPPGKVVLYLHIASGALNETDEQNGLAHFLEHMAFKGSANFEPGKLIPLLSQIGMTFGADTNAHTNLRETVYKLTMPDTKPETIETALKIFSDYASALSLLPAEIDSERGVVLEEARTRKSVDDRFRREMNRKLFEGSHFAIHDLIGDETQIKTFPQAQFQDYWNAWYRPELMTLIVAGDVDPEAILAPARAMLGSFKARAPRRDAIKGGLHPFNKPRAFILTDPDQVSGEIIMMTLHPARPRVTTVALYRDDLIESAAESIINRRFADIVSKGNAVFRSAGVGSADMYREAHNVYASSEGEPQDWNKQLDAVVGEINRALDHGFTERELDLVRRDLLSSAAYAVKTEPTRDSTQIVTMLAHKVGREEPILSAQQRLDLAKEILTGATANDLHAAFTANFKTKNFAYVLMLPSSKKGMKIPDSEEVLAAAAAAWAKKAAAPEEIAQTGSILPAEPTAGQVASRQFDKDLGLTDVVFENGVVLHHKFGDYKKDQVLVQITLPGGGIEENADTKGISNAASVMLAQPATSRYTSSQIRDLLTGKNVSVAGGFGLDAVTLRVSGSTEDLPIGLELAHALLTDGKLEQSALDEWKKNQIKAIEAKKTTPQGQISDAIAATVLGGDVRLAPLTEEIVDRQDRSSAEAWFQRIAQNAAIEVAVVGDISADNAIALVAKYFGSLPRRAGTFDAMNPLRKLDRNPGPFEKTVRFKSVTPKAMVLAGFIGCDERDRDRRPLSLMSLIMSERMIKRIRMQEQLVYSIRCQSMPGKGLPGIGMINVTVPTDPENADKLTALVLEMLTTFAKDGPTDNELATAKKQIANTLSSQMKEPEFWLTQIGDMTYRRRPMSDIKELPDVFQTFTTEQVRDAAAKYITPERAIRLEAIPRAAAASAPAEAAASQN